MYTCTVSVNKCGGSYNTIDDPYTRVFVPFKVKSMILKVYNIISGINETRSLVQHESYECKCGLNESVWNSLQKWNHDECRCGYKELSDWASCINDYIWNPSTCDCECNKASKIDEYLDIENCSSEKHLFDNLVLICEDQISYTTETSRDDKIVICENNWLIHTISLVIICLLLLAVFSTSCCYFFTRYWENVVSI